MIFNSLHFALFLPLVFILYWFLLNRNLRFQNLLLLVSSYFFYACWDWRFLFLLVFSTILDYYTGLKIASSTVNTTRKFWFWLSILTNLGFLGFFKYYNFFASSFERSLAHLGLTVNPWALNVILPLGISFYTFHGLSYIIDVYKRRIEPEKSLIDYSLFVSFFPLLVAGPIERATHLLPQIRKKRPFEAANAIDGLKQILWGLFKKLVIADRCAEYANLIFQKYNTSGSTNLLGAVLFAFQIYADFSGYSDIAIGTARLFGIELLKNFAFPYFSRDIAEFWRRWHISLTTWFRDYLYIPLGGSQKGTWIKVRNTFIIFLVSGFWHGAHWTFVFWGFLNALYIMPSILLKTNRNNLDTVARGKIIPSFRDAISMLATFLLTVIAWIFFRVDTLANAFSYTSRIFSKSLFTIPVIKMELSLYIILLIFWVLEWLGRERPYAIASIGANWPKPVRWSFYYILIITMFYFSGSKQPFIYFQF